MNQLPSDKDIMELIHKNKERLLPEELAYLQKLAKLIALQRRDIRAMQYIAKSSNVHSSSNGWIAQLWLRYRRRLNWIDFQRTIRNAQRRALKPFAWSKTFQATKSRLPKSHRKRKK